MKKKKNTEKEIKVWVISLIAVAIFLFIIIDINSKRTEDKTEETVINMHQGLDFKNDVQGTFSLDLAINKEMFSGETDSQPNTLVFFNSKIVPGLTLYYNPEETYIEGGLPLIRAENINLLDGNLHKIVYTFEKNKEQKIYFDGKEVASSKFKEGIKVVTGNTIFNNKNYKKINTPSNEQVFDKALTTDEIQNLK